MYESVFHNDTDMQGAPRPQKGGAYTATIIGAHHSPAACEEKSDFDINGGFLWFSSFGGRVFVFNTKTMSMLLTAARRSSSWATSRSPG